MPRRALVLAVLLGGAAWTVALATLRGEFAWYSIGIGFLALFPGARLVGARGSRVPRRVVALLALSALPGAMALGFSTFFPIDQRGGLSGFSYWDRFRGALVVSRHAVPEEEWPERPLHRIVFRMLGELQLDWEPITLRGLSVAVQGIPVEDLRLHADSDTPWRSVLWLMAELAKGGIDRIPVAATVGGPKWPIRRIPRALVSADSAGALQVDVVARSEVRRRWGPFDAAVTVRMPVRVKYRFRERTTEDLEELADWLREAAGGRPFVIRVRAGNKIPLKFVVAAATAAFDAGADAWETGALPALPDEERDRVYLTYPARNCDDD